MKEDENYVTNEESIMSCISKGKIITYEYLEKIVENLENQINKDNITHFEKLMYVLLAYGYDFVAASEEKLIETLNLVPQNFELTAIAKTYVMDKDRCSNTKELKAQLLKKIGSYEMIVHYNWFIKNYGKENIKVEFVLNKLDASEVTDIVLKVNNEELDIFDAVKYSIDNEFVFDGEISLQLAEKLGINLENITQKIDSLTEDKEEDDDNDEAIKPFIPIMDGFTEKIKDVLRKIHRYENVGRNDPCPCGSGKKYKKCCGK